jgi:hypothetical protein
MKIEITMTITDMEIGHNFNSKSIPKIKDEGLIIM